MLYELFLLVKPQTLNISCVIARNFFFRSYSDGPLTKTEQTFTVSSFRRFSSQHMLLEGKGAFHWKNHQHFRLLDYGKEEKFSCQKRKHSWNEVSKRKSVSIQLSAFESFSRVYFWWKIFYLASFLIQNPYIFILS